MSRLTISRIERNLMNGDSRIEMRFFTDRDGATISIGLQDGVNEIAATEAEIVARVKAKAKTLLLEAAEAL